MNEQEYQIIAVFNYYTELIAFFLVKSKMVWLSLDGNLYQYDEGYNDNVIPFRFYILENKEFLNSTLTNIDTASRPILTQFSASSYLTEKFDINIYHPVKVFDNKPDTGWLEKAAGPGLGEYISLELSEPITIDKLIIMPGWFDKRYWAENNRVKTALLQLGDKSITANFKDIMEPQEVKLESPISFKTFKLTVKDIYKTTKWDDTAIAEIQFYYQGKKIELDISQYSEYLKVVPEKSEMSKR